MARPPLGTQRYAQPSHPVISVMSRPLEDETMPGKYNINCYTTHSNEIALGEPPCALPLVPLVTLLVCHYYMHSTLD